MAELMIEQWHLAVLRIGLDVSGRTPRVTSALVGYPDGQRQELWTRHDDLAGFGLAGSTPPERLHLPEGMRDAVARSLADELGNEAALWLRIIPPSGFLGAVPWESALRPDVGVPVLRVPDRFPMGQEAGRVWRVAVAVNAERGAGWGAEHVRSLMAALQQRGPRPAEVDVFCDAGTHELLMGSPPPSGPGLAVRVHDPAMAASTARQATARKGRRGRGPDELGSVWATWMTASLQGQAVRALHVATDAALDVDVPWLSLAPDPSEPVDRSSCGYVGGEQVRRLADAVGAPVLTFGSPPGNPSDVATRLLADSSGLVRPGPTMYVDLAATDDAGPGAGARALAEAHALVWAPDRRPIPRSPALFAYLQPEHVQPALRESWPLPGATGPGYVEADAQDERLLMTGSPPPLPDSLMKRGTEGGPHPDRLPTWVASSERFIDTKVAGLLRGAATTGDSSPGRLAHDRGTAEALEELRQMVQRHAGQS